jgi:serine/threonine-protein kinase
MGDEGDTSDDSTRFIPVGGNDETRFTGVVAPAPAAGGKPDATLPPGSLLGHTYRIEAFLARGGMGEVYRARHAELNTEHAIKIILPELANNQRIVDLFRREASVLRNVRHDAVVAYDGVFRDENGRLYLVMEFADGPSLSKLMRERPLNADEVRQLRDRLADGLAVAHDKGVVHRDISPDNVILPGGDLGKAKIIDFGISKAVDPEVKTIIGDDFAGKFSYVSPEQLGMFGGQVDGRSDIYSLGLVLAAAAQGEPLDMGLSPIAVIEARRAVPDLSRVPAAVRADLAAMLQPDPAKRPQSMRDLIRPQEQRGGRRSTLPETSRQRSATKRGGGRIGAVQIVGALAVLVAAGGALGYWYWKGRSGAGDTTDTAQLADDSAQQNAGSTTSNSGATDTASTAGQTTQQTIAAVTSDQAQTQSSTASTSAQGADAGATTAQQQEGTAGTTTSSSTAATAGDTGQANQSNTATAAKGAGESASATQDGTTAAAAGDVHSQSQSSQDGASATTVTTATDQSAAATDQQSASTAAISGAGTSDQSATKTETTGGAISSKVADQSTGAATSNSNAAATTASGAAAGKTATDMQTALLPQVPDVAKLRNDAARAVQGLSCAGIRVDVSDAGQIAASGYVASEADRNKAAARLAALPNTGQIDNAVVVMTPPLCQVLDVLRAETAFALGVPGLDPGGVAGVYREGDHIKVAVTAPAGFDGYLYVDYIDATDRYVLHLLPNNDFRRNNRVSAGEQIVIGSLPAEYDLYVIQPPFGTNLIIAVTSRQPLFDRMRKTQESVDEYLPALRSSLKRVAAEGGSTGLAAAYSSVVLRGR